MGRKGELAREWTSKFNGAGRELTWLAYYFVIPAKAGIQAVPKSAVSRLRWFAMVLAS